MAKVKQSTGNNAPTDAFHILPYSSVVGQEMLKRALELAYIAPGIGGVLISGERGTAKSTTVRAFARMVYGGLPVTLPINATEDRVVGGWRIESLLRGKSEPRPGLLEEANGKLLYIDEVNLLDDHIVNLILDVASTGVLDIQREGFSANRNTRFTLVGTMNPDEGVLRAQLLDRFGLMVEMSAVRDTDQRKELLNAVLDFDQARTDPKKRAKVLGDAATADHKRLEQLNDARADLHKVAFSEPALDRCIDIVQEFEAQGHRGEQAMALAAKAFVARTIAAGTRREPIVKPSDVDEVAKLAIQHRRPRGEGGDFLAWTKVDDDKLRNAGKTKKKVEPIAAS